MVHSGLWCDWFAESLANCTPVLKLQPSFFQVSRGTANSIHHEAPEVPPPPLQDVECLRQPSNLTRKQIREKEGNIRTYWHKHGEASWTARVSNCFTRSIASPAPHCESLLGALPLETPEQLQEASKMLPRMTPGCAGFDASKKRNARISTRSNAKALAGGLGIRLFTLRRLFAIICRGWSQPVLYKEQSKNCAPTRSSATCPCLAKDSSLAIFQFQHSTTELWPL